MQLISPDAIEHRYDQQNGGHWFEPDTLRFFKSRISEGFSTKWENVYFVTSEKGPHGPRAYSVRRLRAVSGHIDTIGPFMAYSTRSSAMASARRLAQTEELEGPRCTERECNVLASSLGINGWECGNHPDDTAVMGDANEVTN